jgi:ribosome-associated protein
LAHHSTPVRIPSQLYKIEAKSLLYHPRRCCLEGIELAHAVVDAILDKKGSDILLLDIREQSIIADYFLLCNGDNPRQLKAIMVAIAEAARENAGIHPILMEGEAESGWVLVDFQDVMVHIFNPETRAYYNLEELWDDAHVVLRVQ